MSTNGEVVKPYYFKMRSEMLDGELAQMEDPLRKVVGCGGCR